MITGKMRFRSTWRGKLILQVEVPYTHTHPGSFVCETRYAWRDARVEDIPQFFSAEGLTDAMQDHGV